MPGGKATGVAVWIFRACALASIFTMGAFVMLASARLGQSTVNSFPEFVSHAHDVGRQAEFALQSRSKGAS